MSATADTDFDAEQSLRMTVLEVLYAKRRMDPHEPGVFHIDLEKLTGLQAENMMSQPDGAKRGACRCAPA